MKSRSISLNRLSSLTLLPIKLMRCRFRNAQFNSVTYRCTSISPSFAVGCTTPS